MTDPTTMPTRVATPAPRAQPFARRRLRLLAFAVTATGLINVLSALTPLMRDRLEVVAEALTPEVAHLARGATALLGVALILLSRGIARHRRLAFRTALVLLAVSAFTHVLKGLDIEEAVVSLGVAVLLLYLVMRDEFDDVVDGILYGAAVGLGFNFMESITYMTHLYAIFQPEGQGLDAAAARGGTAEPLDEQTDALGPLRELVDGATFGIIVRAALPLSAQPAFADAAARADRGARIVADAASGIVHVHLREDPPGIVAAADALVANARILGGNARIERSSLAGLEPFSGPAPAGAFLMRRLKDAFDPSGILEPARSALG